MFILSLEQLGVFHPTLVLVSSDGPDDDDDDDADTTAAAATAYNGNDNGVSFSFLSLPVWKKKQLSFLPMFD